MKYKQWDKRTYDERQTVRYTCENAPDHYYAGEHTTYTIGYHGMDGRNQRGLHICAARLASTAAARSFTSGNGYDNTEGNHEVDGWQSRMGLFLRILVLE